MTIVERQHYMRWLALALFTTATCGAEPAPEFPAAGVVFGDRTATVLVPGAHLSIYGRYLGPDSGCSESAKPVGRETPNPRAPDWWRVDTLLYPSKLCDTQVLIGSQLAGLLFVSDKQINLKIPQDAPEDQTVELRVVYQGQPSLPVRMRAGFEKTSVSLDGPAYTDMPVWLQVDLPTPTKGYLGYPSALGPARFGCTGVEARRNGQLLPFMHGADWDRMGVVIAGNICGSYLHDRSQPDQLPIHLLYRFDLPGDYEVRFAWYDAPWGAQIRGVPRYQSPWTAIHVLPPNQRARWLEALRRRNPQDAAELLTDVLPSVLGIPDDASLDFISGYLYHPDGQVRSYAFNGLNYWPDTQVVRKLNDLLQTSGEMDVVRRGIQQRLPH